MRAAWALAGLLALAAALPARAQSLGTPVPSRSAILTLDPERLFNESVAAERLAAMIEERSEALAQENRRIEAELMAEELELTERRPEMEPEAFRELADAFDEKVQRLREVQDAKARDLQRLREEERQRLLRQITPILGAIVQERGAVVVLDRRSVFLSADRIDITDEVIERVNAELDGPADAPAPEDPAEDGSAPGTTPPVAPDTGAPPLSIEPDPEAPDDAAPGAPPE